MGRIKAVIFDLDGTLVRYQGVEFESSWGAIGVAAGVKKEWDQLLGEYLSRKGAYAEWMQENARLLAGIPVEKLDSGLFPPPYAVGVPNAIEQLRGSYRLGILSSGVDLVADRVRLELGLDFAVANRLLVSGGRFTGATETVVDLWEKAKVMRRLAERQGLALHEICYVGDHINDLPVMQIVGASIAYNPKDERLEKIADVVTSDFARIPAILGEIQAQLK